MREGFPSSASKHERADVRVLRDVQTRLAERMKISGHEYTADIKKESISFHADAENFAQLLGHLEELLDEVNAQHDTPHLAFVVRGMHEVDIQLSSQ